MRRGSNEVILLFPACRQIAGSLECAASAAVYPCMTSSCSTIIYLLKIHLKFYLCMCYTFPVFHDLEGTTFP